METKQLLNQITQQLKVVSNDSVTPAGQSEQAPPSDEQLSAINQIFELFRFNYHNQFLKAFPDLDTLNIAKRLWLRLLSEYDGNVIMRAAEKTVKDRKSTRLNSSHVRISYAVFCLKKKNESRSEE